MVIYKTTNLINGKYYIGKDKHNDPTYLGSGLILSQAVQKYGKHNFKKEILEQCDSEKTLNEREKYWINALSSNVRGIGYNIADGGCGGNTFTNQSDVRKIEIRKHLTESFHTKVKNSEGYKNRGIKISQSKIGCVFSKRHKHNLSVAHKGKPAWNRGKKLPKLSDAKTIKIDPKIVKIIGDLYLSMSPKMISDVLKDLEILSVSIIVIRRVLKEQGVYISSNIRLRANPNITREEAITIAKGML